MVKSNMDKQIRLPERWPNYKHPVLPFTFSLVVLLGLLACSNFQNSQSPGLPAAETPTTAVESSSKDLRGIESVPAPTQVTLLPETDTPVTVLEPTPTDLPAPVRVPPPNHRPKLPVADTPATPVAPAPTGQPVPASVPPPTKQPPGKDSISPTSIPMPATSSAQPSNYRFSDITVGQGHSCGLLTSGEVLCWGSNRFPAGHYVGQAQPPPGSVY